VFHSKPFHSHVCYKCFSALLWRCGHEFSASTVADCYCLLLRYTLRCTVVRTVFVRTTLVHSLYSIRLTAVWNIFRISEFMCRQSIFHATQLLTCSTIATMAAICVFNLNSPPIAHYQLTVGAEPASSPTGEKPQFSPLPMNLQLARWRTTCSLALWRRTRSLAYSPTARILALWR